MVRRGFIKALVAAVAACVWPWKKSQAAVGPTPGKVGVFFHRPFYRREWQEASCDLCEYTVVTINGYARYAGLSPEAARWFVSHPPVLYPPLDDLRRISFHATSEQEHKLITKISWTIKYEEKRSFDSR